MYTPQADHPLGQIPTGQTPPWTDIPSGQTPPPGETSPWADTPLLGRHPSNRRLLRRTVRILLECILVVEMVIVAPMNRKLWCHVFNVIIGHRMTPGTQSFH